MYSMPIFWLGFMIDLMTFRMLDFEVMDASIDDKVDESVDMSKGRGKKDAIIIVYTSYILYLQLSLRKS